MAHSGLINLGLAFLAHLGRSTLPAAIGLGSVTELEYHEDSELEEGDEDDVEEYENWNYFPG